MTPEQISAKVAAGYIKAASKVGSSIVFRRVTQVKVGATPYINPVTSETPITVSVDAFSGAASVTLTAPSGGNWSIESGDVLTIGGSDYTVTARTLSASGKFTGVPVSPVLAGNVSAGAAVAVTWQADYACRAMVDSFRADLIDGTLIRVGDLRVKIPVRDAAGRTIPEPTPLDKVKIGTTWRSIGIVQPERSGADPAWFAVSARG